MLLVHVSTGEACLRIAIVLGFPHVSWVPTLETPFHPLHPFHAAAIRPNRTNGSRRSVRVYAEPKKWWRYAHNYSSELSSRVTRYAGATPERIQAPVAIRCAPRTRPWRSRRHRFLEHASGRGHPAPLGRGGPSSPSAGCRVPERPTSIGAPTRPSLSRPPRRAAAVELDPGAPRLPPLRSGQRVAGSTQVPQEGGPRRQPPGFPRREEVAGLGPPLRPALPVVQLNVGRGSLPFPP